MSDGIQGEDPGSVLRASGFIKLQKKNVSILYHSENGVIDPADLMVETERILNKVKQVLGIDLGEVEIEIFRNKKEWIDRHTVISEADLPSWVQGDSGRVIRVVMDDAKISSMDELLLMVTHECVHAAIRGYTRERCAAWLDEGLATYLTQELPKDYLEAFKKALSADALLPFEMLTTSFSRLDRKMKYLAYAQSHFLVEYLVSKYGWEVIKELLGACSCGDSEEAVLRMRGLNMYLLEKEWIRECKGFKGSRVQGIK